MKSLERLLQVILEEIGDRCCVSTTRDYKTITSRIKDEGLSFITITLANYGSDLQKGLDRGYVARDLFQGLSWTEGLPRLFSGFLELIFDRATGQLLPVPNIDAIIGLRQIYLMWAKIRMETTKHRNHAAILKYKECEQDVKSFDQSFLADTTLKSRFARISGLLWGDVFFGIDRKVERQEIVPRHGPGTTADKLIGNNKYNQTEWTDRLEAIFPSGRYARANFRDYLERPVDILEPGRERPVEVILVPKTMKTPRIIAREPTCMQYMQQGLMREFVEMIESHKVVRHFVGFTDQTPNQRMAMIGSRDGSYATLDMSEASDRVSYQHVRLMLRNFRFLAEAVDATRSRKAVLPDGSIIRLAKFASMGSALCFPFEAMVFTTVVLMGIEDALNRPLLHRDVLSLRGQVRVYGDDIVVPVKYAQSVSDSLESFGFKVNTGKSFWNGKFRESCGKDYYDGTDVTLVRLRSLFPTKPRQTEEIVSLIEFRNQLYIAGYWKTVRHLDHEIEKLKLPFPAVLETSPGIGKTSFLGYQTDGWDPDLQKPLVRALVVVPKKRPSYLDGWGAMLKFFIKDNELPFIDPEHLLYAGRPVAVDIKHRRVSPY